MKQIVMIPSERAEELRKLSIEVESRKFIIESMIQNKMDITSETFKAYQAEFQQFYAEYDAKKSAVQSDFIDGKIANAKTWDLNFNTCELTVEC